MKKFLSLVALFAVVLGFAIAPAPTEAANVQLLSSPWQFVVNNGDHNLYVTPAQNVLNNKVSLTLTYDLNGTCILGGDASAIIFDQNGWKYISLSNYGTNCTDGQQVVTIPLSAFSGLNTSANLTGSFHARFWKGSGGPYTIDITSAVLNEAPAPVISSFTANPTTIVEGNSSTLSWSQTGATSLSIDNGVGTVTGTSVSVSPTTTTTYTLTATNATGNDTEQATVTVTPAIDPTWDDLQSVDVMKYSKDVLCSPPSEAFIDYQLDKIVDIGANYVGVSGFYDEPSCNSTGAITTLTRWVEGARDHDLKVWFRFKNKAFEGDYSTTKSTSPDNMRHQKLMVDWIAAHGADLIEPGDIFTPNAEPQNGGINGVTYCANSVCQFSGKADFNLWLRQTHTMADLAIKAAGVDDVKIGYYGFDGFVVAGLGNPDWQGQSQLEASTIAMMGPVAIDHYPETIGHTLEQDLPYIKQAIGSSTPIIISEYGYIGSGTEAQRAAGITAFMEDAAAEPNIDGFQYWHLGPGGNEALVTGSGPFTENLLFDAVEAFYK